MYNETRPTVPRDLAVFGDWMNELFRLWSANTGVWIVQGVIYFAIAVLPAILLYFIFFGSMVISSFQHNSNPDSDSITFAIVLYGLMLLAGLITAFLYPGMVLTALKQMRGKNISSTDIFSGMSYGLGYIAVSFLAGFGILACCLGIYVTNGMLFLALPLMVDKDYSTSQAISSSWETTKQNYWLYILFCFVVTMLGSVGASACYIGLIITIPFMAIGQAVAYERTYFAPNLPPTNAEKPAEYLPPPPYSSGNSGSNIWK